MNEVRPIVIAVLLVALFLLGAALLATCEGNGRGDPMIYVGGAR